MSADFWWLQLYFVALYIDYLSAPRNYICGNVTMLPGPKAIPLVVDRKILPTHSLHGVQPGFYFGLLPISFTSLLASLVFLFLFIDFPSFFSSLLKYSTFHFINQTNFAPHLFLGYGPVFMISKDWLNILWVKQSVIYWLPFSNMEELAKALKSPFPFSQYP